MTTEKKCKECGCLIPLCQRICRACEKKVSLNETEKKILNVLVEGANEE